MSKNNIKKYLGLLIIGILTALIVPIDFSEVSIREIGLIALFPLGVTISLVYFFKLQFGPALGILMLMFVFIYPDNIGVSEKWDYIAYYILFAGIGAALTPNSPFNFLFPSAQNEEVRGPVEVDPSESPLNEAEIKDIDGI